MPEFDTPAYWRNVILSHRKEKQRFEDRLAWLEERGRSDGNEAARVRGHISVRERAIVNCQKRIDELEKPHEPAN